MTRSGFITQVNAWSDLLDFCCAENLDCCDDIIIGDKYDEEIYSDLDEAYCEVSWMDLRDMLNGLPSHGYPYYIKDPDCWLDFQAITENDRDIFENYKGFVIRAMDDRDTWDDEDDLNVVDSDEINIFIGICSAVAC